MEQEIQQNTMGDIFCFIKFTQKEFAKKLIKKGQICFNIPKHYSNLEEDERGDKNEGAIWIMNEPLAKIEVSDPNIGTVVFYPNQDTNSKAIQFDDRYLIYSLYAITAKSFEKDGSFKIDRRMAEFGDTAVIIKKPDLFLDALFSELKSKKINYKMSPVFYRNLTDNGKIDLSPFDKKDDHQHQC